MYTSHIVTFVRIASKASYSSSSSSSSSSQCVPDTAICTIKFDKVVNNDQNLAVKCLVLLYWVKEREVSYIQRLLAIY